MFAKSIVDSDAFLDMPMSAQCLYFHLGMRADDDGFVNNPKKIQRTVGAGDDDMKLLIAKRFILVFDSGIIVIKHWKIHNYIQKDRYKPTHYLEEKSLLSQKSDGSYTLDTQCIQDGYNLDTQVRLGEDSLELGKDSLGEVTPAPGRESLSYYMDAINPMPPSTVVSEMQDYVDELSDKVVLHAIQIAVGERKVGWNYIRAILRNYKAEGVKTMEDVLRREEEHQKKRNPDPKDPYATYYDDNPFEGWDE